MAKTLVLWEGDFNKRVIARYKPANFNLKPYVITIEFGCNGAVLDALDSDPLLLEKTRSPAVEVVKETVADVVNTLKSYDRMLGDPRTLTERDGFRMDFYDLYEEKIEVLHVKAQEQSRKGFDRFAKSLADYRTFKVGVLKKATKGAAKTVVSKAVSSAAPAMLSGGVTLVLGATFKLTRIAWDCHVLCRDVDKDLRNVEKKMPKLKKVIQQQNTGKKAAAKSMARGAASKLPGLNLAPEIKEIEGDLERIRGKIGRLEKKSHKLTVSLNKSLGELDGVMKDPAVTSDAALKSSAAALEKAVGETIDSIIELQALCTRSSANLKVVTACFSDLKAAKDPGLAAKTLAKAAARLRESKPGVFAEKHLAPKIKKMTDVKSKLETNAKQALKKWKK